MDVPWPVGLHGTEIRLVRAGSWMPSYGRSREDVECVAMHSDASFFGRADSLGRFRVLAAPGKYRLKSDDHEDPAVEVRARETTRIEFRVE